MCDIPHGFEATENHDISHDFETENVSDILYQVILKREKSCVMSNGFKCIPNDFEATKNVCDIPHDFELKRLKTCVTHCVTDQFVISLFCVCVLELGRSRFIKVPKHEDFDSCPRNFGKLKLSS